MAKFMLCLWILAACARDVLSVTDYYMSSHCGDTLNVNFNEQVRLQLTPYQYRNNWDCQLHLCTTDGNKFHVHFTSMDIERESNCLYDRLTISDVTSSSTFHARSSNYYMCGYRNTHEYKNSGPVITFDFHSDRAISGSGFVAIITPFHTGFRLEDEFKCDNGRCIDDFIKCSDHNPCGDNSEPVDCPSDDDDSSSLNGGVISLISVSVIAVTCIIITVVVRCTKKQGTSNRINVSTIEPVNISMVNTPYDPRPHNKYNDMFR